jgi:hypothetical protein
MARFFPIALVLTLACGENVTPLPDRPMYESPDAGVLSCIPNLDGRIDPSELEAAIGVPVTLLVSPPGVERPVDLVGQVVDEQRVWDFATDYADSTLARLEAAPLEGQWFADEFSPDGTTFVTPIDPGGSTVGVYRKDDAALSLLGVASAQPDPPEGRTLLVYQTPIALYRFPIEVGASHVSTGVVMDGTLRGLPYAGRDIYEVDVRSSGRIELPDLAFDQALRVDVRVTVEPAVGEATSRRQVSFLFECFGEVARATSRPNEAATDFTTAAELRRLSLE